MQIVGCITTFLHSVNATCESNETGRFSARLGNTEIFDERRHVAFLLLLRPTYMQK